MQTKHKHILVPCWRYQDSRHLLQYPKASKNVMRFNNHAQRSTPPYYLDVDNPLPQYPIYHTVFELLRIEEWNGVWMNVILWLCWNMSVSYRKSVRRSKCGGISFCYWGGFLYNTHILSFSHILTLLHTISILYIHLQVFWNYQTHLIHWLLMTNCCLCEWGWILTDIGLHWVSRRWE